jgi:predicted ATPase
MFLRNLKISNLRSIESLDMDFATADGGPRHWTFLLGENGAGKSTLLRAIALASAGGEALPEIVGDPDSWIRSGKAEASIELGIATAAGESRDVRLVLRRGAGIKQLLMENTEALERIDAAIEKSTRNYFVIAYGVSRRRSFEGSLPSPGGPYRNNRAQNVATLFSADATLVSIEQWAMDLDYRRGPAGLNAVRSALDTLLPDMAFAGVDKERRRLEFRTPDGTLPLSYLSDGYQAMAAWCGDVLFRITETFADYEDPLKARGLLLIDELDLHLHPLWQRQLVSFLQRTLPNFQVVATTHSPLTVHQAGEGELFLLRRHEDYGPACLEHFQGAANRLLLHELIQSPFFGLDTLDSVPVADLRRELRVLQQLPEASVPARVRGTVRGAATGPDTPQQRTRRIREITAELEGLPTVAAVPEYQKTTNELLAKIASELSTKDGRSGPSGGTRSAKPRNRR